MAFKLGAQKCLTLSQGHKEGTRCRSFNIPVFPSGVSSQGALPWHPWWPAHVPRGSGATPSEGAGGEVMLWAPQLWSESQPLGDPNTDSSSSGVPSTPPRV